LNDLRKLLIYLVASLVLGALFAPLLFKGGRWLAGVGIFPSLETQGFQRYFNRSVQIVAILLLWPLVRALRVRSLAELGLHHDPAWLRRGLIGLTAAVVLMVVMSLIVHASGGMLFLPAEQRKVHEWPKVVVTAFSVGFIEECIFRGAFLGLLQRRMSRNGALFASSAFFSVLHFVKPIKTVIAPSEVSWLSGFAVIPGVFSQWADPAMIGALFTTLFAVGWVLGWATQRTHSLWMSIGLHAGWVLCVQGFGKFAMFADGGLPWIGSDLRIGIAPLLTVLLTGVVCRVSLAYVDRPQSS
jgi:membrane protease YdiL (CAAX protease family)